MRHTLTHSLAHPAAPRALAALPRHQGGGTHKSQHPHPPDGDGIHAHHERLLPPEARHARAAQRKREDIPLSVRPCCPGDSRELAPGGSVPTHGAVIRRGRWTKGRHSEGEAASRVPEPDTAPYCRHVHCQRCAAQRRVVDRRRSLFERRVEREEHFEGEDAACERQWGRD